MIFFEATVFWQQCIVSQGLEESKTGCGTKTPCHVSNSFVFEVQIRWHCARKNKTTLRIAPFGTSFEGNCSKLLKHTVNNATSHLHL